MKSEEALNLYSCDDSGTRLREIPHMKDEFWDAAYVMQLNDKAALVSDFGPLETKVGWPDRTIHCAYRRGPLKYDIVTTKNSLFKT